MMMYKQYTQTLPTKSVILGIDPGYGRLGYAIFEKTETSEKLLDYSCVENPIHIEYSEKILNIAKEIEKVIKKHKPNTLAIEKLYFTKNQKTALQVSEIRGIILYLAIKNKLKITEYTPLEVKLSVCGYGKATKPQVEKMVKMLLKLKETPKYDDTTDAIALCLTCVARNDYF
ncbi:MAG: crossover junction endodeoxyribonuclease RuvC [Patescibacteria group bacterium]